MKNPGRFPALYIAIISQRKVPGLWELFTRNGVQFPGNYDQVSVRRAELLFSPLARVCLARFLWYSTRNPSLVSITERLGTKSSFRVTLTYMHPYPRLPSLPLLAPLRSDLTFPFFAMTESLEYT